LFKQATHRKASELIKTSVLPAAEEACEQLEEDIAGLEEQVQKQTGRLAELKVARDTDPGMLALLQAVCQQLRPRIFADAFYLSKEGEDGGALDGVDAMTDATTALRTDYTRYTVGATTRTGGTQTSRSS